jgi:hypothetical protein
MADFRCPTHDVVFQSMTDHRKPGSNASGNFQAHPEAGHPDCPLCQDDIVAGVTRVPVTRGEGGARVRAPRDTRVRV